MKKISVFATVIAVIFYSLLSVSRVHAQIPYGTHNLMLGNAAFSGNNVTVGWSDVCTFHIPSSYSPASGKLYARLFFDALANNGTLIGSTVMQYVTYTPNNGYASVTDGTAWTLTNSSTINYVTTFAMIYSSKYGVPPPGDTYKIRFRLIGYDSILDNTTSEWPDSATTNKTYPYLITR